MYSNYLLKLSEHTILREIMGKVYMNEVRKHTVLLLTQEAMPILTYMFQARSYEEIRQFFKSNYEIEDSIEEYCEDFVRNLIEIGFLEIQSDNYEIANINEKIENIPDYDNKVELEEMALEKQQLLSATIELTYACNLKCKHCFVGDTKNEKLSKEFYFDLLDELYEMGTLNIVFTGGEVFARQDSLEIIRYAIEKNFIVDVFTNGTLIDDTLFEKLCCLNIHSVQSSIYSTNADIHDSFVGKKGAFHRTLSNLKKFSEAGIMTAVKTCVFDFNCTEFEELKKLATSINAAFQYTMTLLPTKDGKTTPMQFGVSKNNLRDFISKIEDSYYYEKEDEQLICSAGQTSLSINPDGKVYMCNAFDLVVGDLKKTTISDIWHNSSKIKEWRKATMAKRVECHQCKYANYCDYCPGAAYKLSGSPYSKYEAACNQAKMIYEILGV